ncbi:MAG TPA: TIGR03943 family protein [Chthoniobacteraceae bacterium]|nr:TIGR03943 family protein [Chthoniobacteraceae bacterium]
MTKTLDRWLPSLTLTLWGSVLLYFFYSGRLSAFLHPSFRPGVMIAGVVLLILAAAVAIGGSASCCEEEACGHSVARLTSGKLLAFGVLILPMTMAFRHSQDGFGMTAIENRGVIMDAAAMGGGAYQGGGEFSPKQVDGRLSISVMDLLYASAEPTLQSEFAGKPVEVIGQLMQESESNPRGNRMKLIRMYMSCCAADARPVGALVEFSTLPPDLPELSWVKVTGVAGFPMEGGRNLAVIKVDGIEPTAAPDESMLY